MLSPSSLRAGFTPLSDCKQLDDYSSFSHLTPLDKIKHFLIIEKPLDILFNSKDSATYVDPSDLTEDMIIDLLKFMFERNIEFTRFSLFFIQAGDTQNDCNKTYQAAYEKFEETIVNQLIEKKYDAASFTEHLARSLKIIAPIKANLSFDETTDSEASSNSLNSQFIHDGTAHGISASTYSPRPVDCMIRTQTRIRLIANAMHKDPFFFYSDHVPQSKGSNYHSLLPVSKNDLKLKFEDSEYKENRNQLLHQLNNSCSFWDYLFVAVKNLNPFDHCKK